MFVCEFITVLWIFSFSIWMFFSSKLVKILPMLFIFSKFSQISYLPYNVVNVFPSWKSYNLLVFFCWRHFNVVFLFSKILTTWMLFSVINMSYFYWCFSPYEYFSIEELLNGMRFHTTEWKNNDSTLYVPCGFCGPLRR